MTVPSRPPELNYVALTGEVVKKGDLKTTNLGIFHFVFSMENILSDVPDRSGKYLLDVETWGNLAESAYRRLKRGSFILVEGRLVSRSFVDRSKRTHYRMVVKASGFTILNTGN